MLRPEAFAHTLMIMRLCALGAGFVVMVQVPLLVLNLTAPPALTGGGSPFSLNFPII